MTAATRSPRCIRHRRRLDRSLRREYSALPSAGHFWPQRPDNLFLYAAGGHISFNSERNMEKNAAKNQRFLDFPCPIPTTVQKGSASNRLYPHPRCRSRVPRENFLLSRRTGEVLYILHNFVSCGPKGRTYTCRRRRQVRDLIIVLNDRPASPPPTTSAAARVNPWPIPCGTFSIRTEIGL